MKTFEFLNQNNGASNQDLNSSKSQERKFFLTVPYLGKPSTTFFKINGFNQKQIGHRNHTHIQNHQNF